MRSVPVRVVVVVVAALAAGCVAGGTPGDPPEPDRPALDEGGAGATTPALAGPESTSAACPDVLDAADATCALLVVPEARGRPAGPVVEVAYAVLAATESPERVGPDPPPLVVLPDGPGQSGLADAASWIASPLRAGREVVLIDPRGTGRSFPSLDCGQPPRPGALPPDLVEDCRRQLDAEAVDRRASDTAAMAADVLDLRQVLDVPAIDLLGVGHGARIALAVIDREPEVVRAAVLDSPVPPEADVYADRPRTAQSVLNRLFDTCAEDRGCERRFGAIGPAVEQVVEALNDDVGETGGVRGDDLALAAVAALRGAGPAEVPAALSLAGDGEPEAALARLQEVAIAGAAVPSSAFAEGLRLSSDCRDEVPSSAVAGGGGGGDDGLGPVGLAVATDVERLVAACALWDVGSAGEGADDPVTADVFALVLSGEFDPLSPPAWGAATATGLDGTVVQVDGAGHRVHDVSECTLAIVDAFLLRPGATVDDGCTEQAGIDFVLG